MPPLNKTEIEFWKGGAENNRSFRVLTEQPLKYSRRPRKVVRFDDRVDLEHVLHFKDYTNDEIEDTWYCGADYSRFRKDIATTTHLILNRPDDVDGLQYTSRGAECRIAKAVERRHRSRFQAWSAVHYEQDFQRVVGDKNDDRVAALYSQTTRSTVRDALDLAALDQLDANQYQNEECQKEAFSDDWIRSISAHHSCAYELRHIQEQSFWDDSGFDDSWIRDVSIPLVRV
jgi:hypothetical protein